MSYRFKSSKPSSVANRYGRTSRAPRPKRSRGVYIDPARFVRAAKPVEADEYQSQHTFSDFNLHPTLMANVAGRGFTIPTPIQDQAIPVGLTGRDVIGIASTGTGKTTAFALPVLHKLIENRNSKALIIAPTRELAKQIEDECRVLGKNSGLSGVLLIGGVPMGPQLRDLRQSPRVVIGTPGRIKDHIGQGTLRLNDFNYVVLDEVDRMLDMGFINDVRFILSELSSDRQSFFFSATMDPAVRNLIETFSKEPHTITLKSSEASENVHQDVVRYGSTQEKFDILHNLLQQQGVAKVIVFDETQRSVERLSKTLADRGHLSDAIHGGKSQGQRQRALDKFKSNHINVLVATDVAARGIDVADITHVINYSVPQSYDDYVHRIGRAGRAGKVGHAFTFVGR